MGFPFMEHSFITDLAASRIKKHFAETLKEDSEGSKTFPIARKLAELAKYYGFDGYFINQETTENPHQNHWVQN